MIATIEFSTFPYQNVYLLKYESHFYWSDWIALEEYNGVYFELSGLGALIKPLIARHDSKTI